MKTRKHRVTEFGCLPFFPFLASSNQSTTTTPYFLPLVLLPDKYYDKVFKLQKLNYLLIQQIYVLCHVAGWEHNEEQEKHSVCPHPSFQVWRGDVTQWVLCSGKYRCHRNAWDGHINQMRAQGNLPRGNDIGTET